MADLRERLESWLACNPSPQDSIQLLPIEVAELLGAARSAIERKCDPDLLAWLADRLQNCETIASHRIGADRSGWLEDAAYFKRAIAMLAAAPAPAEPVQEIPGYPNKSHSDAAPISAPRVEADRIGFERYEYLRTLTPNRFTELWREALGQTENTFDDTVDKWRRLDMKQEPGQ